MGRWALLLIALAAGGGFIAELFLMVGDPPPAVGDHPRQGWTLAWLIWLVATVLAFAVIEGLALANDHGGDTLTEHIQWIAGKSPVWTGIIGIGIASFFAWFLSHLFGRDSRIWRYLELRAVGEPPEAADPPSDPPVLDS